MTVRGMGWRGLQEGQMSTEEDRRGVSRRVLAVSVRGSQAGERRCPLCSPPTLLSLEGEEQPNQTGGWEAGKRGALNKIGRGPGGSPAVFLSSPPGGETSLRGEDAAPAPKAVNTPSGPVLPTGPSPPPHLRTLEWLHHSLDALLGHPPQPPAGSRPRLSKLRPLPVTVLPRP